ncbi:MAG: hypothetical protein H8E14_11105 [Candidatus Marinimicrobia bacterium]|nr:hypothetical protein [Candidatus Neomarinimicrobiota bacterium]
MKKLIKNSAIILLIAGLCSCTSEKEPEWNNPFYPVFGPAVVLNPIEIQAQVSTTFKVAVRFEEVLDVIGLHVDIQYDTLALKLLDARVMTEGEDLLISTNAEILSFFTYLSGQIRIDLGIAQGHPLGISGSGDVIQLEFEAIEPGESYITFGSGCRLTDRDLNEIPIFQTRGGVVYVE